MYYKAVKSAGKELIYKYGRKVPLKEAETDKYELEREDSLVNAVFRHNGAEIKKLYFEKIT